MANRAIGAQPKENPMSRIYTRDEMLYIMGKKLNQFIGKMMGQYEFLRVNITLNSGSVLETIGEGRQISPCFFTINYREESIILDVSLDAIEACDVTQGKIIYLCQSDLYDDSADDAKLEKALENCLKLSVGDAITAFFNENKPSAEDS